MVSREAAFLYNNLVLVGHRVRGAVGNALPDPQPSG